jgi:hypothetical protein
MYIMRARTLVLDVLREVDRVFTAPSIENARRALQQAERRRAMEAAIDRAMKESRDPHRVA